MRVRIVRCDCMEIAERRIKPGVHDGVVGDAVGSTPQGHTLVRFAPLAIACRAREVEPDRPPPQATQAYTFGGAE